MTLVEFLKARLDEDVALAREAQDGPWHIGNAVDPTQPCHIHTFPRARGVADNLGWLDAEHIVRHNPARVLREVEAKRRMIAAYEASTKGLRYPTHEAGMVDGLEWAMQFLALPYADHPDYRQEWAP